MVSPLSIVLDTDIGDDIDDALALALALNSPEIEVRAVTTVYAHAPRRAQLVEHLLRVGQREDIPVFAGCSKPLRQSLKVQSFAQFEVLDGDEKTYPHAVDYLAKIETGMTIIAIGALTNVAVALAREPELAKRARLIWMGGSPDGKTAEWNTLCDPEAAAIVLDSGMDVSMIGLNVTEQCQLDEAFVTQLAQQETEKARALSRLISLWHRDAQRAIVIHDPLTVLSLFEIGCVQFEERRVEIGLCGEDRGKVRTVAGAPNCRVAIDVDAPRA